MSGNNIKLTPIVAKLARELIIMKKDLSFFRTRWAKIAELFGFLNKFIQKKADLGKQPQHSDEGSPGAQVLPLVSYVTQFSELKKKEYSNGNKRIDVKEYFESLEGALTEIASAIMVAKDAAYENKVLNKHYTKISSTVISDFELIQLVDWLSKQDLEN